MSKFDDAAGGGLVDYDALPSESGGLVDYGSLPSEADSAGGGRGASRGKSGEQEAAQAARIAFDERKRKRDGLINGARYSALINEARDHGVRYEPVQPSGPSFEAGMAQAAGDAQAMRRRQLTPVADAAGPRDPGAIVDDLRDRLSAYAPEQRIGALRAMAADRGRDKRDLYGQAAVVLLADVQDENARLDPRHEEQATRLGLPGQPVPAPSGGGGPPQRARTKIPDVAPNFGDTMDRVAPADVAQRRTTAQDLQRAARMGPTEKEINALARQKQRDETRDVPGLFEGTVFQPLGSTSASLNQGVSTAIAGTADALIWLNGLSGGTFLDEAKTDHLNQLSAGARRSGDSFGEMRSRELRNAEEDQASIVQSGTALELLGHIAANPALLASQIGQSAASMVLPLGLAKTASGVVMGLSARVLAAAPKSAAVSAAISELGTTAALRGAIAGEALQGAGGVYRRVLEDGGSEQEAGKAAGATFVGYLMVGKATGGGVTGALATGRVAAGKMGSAAVAGKTILKEGGKGGAEEYLQTWSEVAGKAFGTLTPIDAGQANREGLAAAAAGAAMGAGAGAWNATTRPGLISNAIEEGVADTHFKNSGIDGFARAALDPTSVLADPNAVRPGGAFGPPGSARGAVAEAPQQQAPQGPSGLINSARAPSLLDTMGVTPVILPDATVAPAASTPTGITPVIQPGATVAPPMAAAPQAVAAPADSDFAAMNREIADAEREAGVVETDKDSAQAPASAEPAAAAQSAAPPEQPRAIAGEAADDAAIGARVTLAGKPWTVLDRSPNTLRLDNGAGMDITVRRGSIAWAQITQADPSRPAETGQGAPNAAQVDPPVGAAISTDALKQTAGPTNTKDDAQPTPTTPRTETPAPPAATATDAAAARAAGGAVEADGLKAERWKMTRIDHMKFSVDALRKKRGDGELWLRHEPNSEEVFRNKANAAHRKHVTDALARGEDVPAEVLADYPGLKRATPNAEHAATAPEAESQAPARSADGDGGVAPTQGSSGTAPNATGGAVEADGLSAATELLDKLAAGFNYKAFNAMPEGLGKTARKLGDAIMGRDAAAMADILNPSNKRSRAAFESLFSGKVKLPATISGTRAVVDDFLSKVSAGINATAPVEAASTSGAAAPVAVAPKPKVYKTKEGAALADKINAKRAQAAAAPDLTTRNGMVKALKKFGYDATDLDAARTKIPDWGRVGVKLNTIPFTIDMVVERKLGAWKFSELESEDPQSISQQEEIAKFKADLAKLVDAQNKAAATNPSQGIADLPPARYERQAAPATLAPATHKDPGEPAEPVTPAVVREAIKTGVQATARKPSAMKAELLAEVDQAVKDSPDYMDFQGAVKALGLKDATASYTSEGRTALGDKVAPQGYSRPTRRFKIEGDGVFFVNNTVRQLLTFRAKVEASKGFSDSKTPAPKMERVTDALDRRSQDQAIANMIDEGDFEAAQDYAAAVGADLADVKLTKVLRERLDKWGQDQASAKRMAEYQAENPPVPTVEPTPTTDPKSEPDKTHEAGIASQTFDQWARAAYAANEYAPRYLQEFDGNEKRAILGLAAHTTDNDRTTAELLKEAKDQYRRSLFALPRETRIGLDVWDALGPLQIEAQRHFYDLDSRITRRTQDETRARVDAEKVKKAPYEAAFAEVDAEIRRLDKIDGPETQKQKDLSARRDRLQEAMYQIGQGKEPDGRLLRKAAEPAATPATQAAAILDAAAEPPKGAERLSVIKDVKAGAITPDEVAAAYPAAQEAAPATPESATPATPAAPAMTGPHRDPTQVNALRAPYSSGDIVTIGGKDWMVKSDTPGWYLTSDGSWRGEHPTIKGIKSQVELIRAVEEAAESATPSAAEKAAPAAVEAKAAAESAASAPMPGISGISMSLAQQAHSGTSFSPERRAEQERDSFNASLKDAWDRAARIAGTDAAAIERITEVFADVADGYHARYTAALQARSRVMSAMITGPARFPVERNRKRMETERKRAEEASEYLARGIKRLLRAARGPIDNSPESELERVRLDLSKREEWQDHMKDTNAALRNGDFDALRDDLGFSEQDVEKLRAGETVQRETPKGVRPVGRRGVPDYLLTNNNAEIRRLRDRLQSAEERMKDAAAGPVETERDGVKIVEDATDDRLRLIFDGKPSEAVREDLKANGFKWSPKNEAWQRQLTDNARRSATLVLDKHYPQTSTDDAGNVAMFSRAPQTDSAAFKRWFGESVVTEDGKTGGKPLVVYHGTAGDFSTFDADADPVNYESDRGKQFFTNDSAAASGYAEDDGSGRMASGANVMPVYLALRNPRIEQVQGDPASWWDSQPALMWKLNVTDQGHDGLIVHGDGGASLYVTNDPKQIKSATGNSGAFDPANPDIRYSRAPAAASPDAWLYRFWSSRNWASETEARDMMRGRIAEDNERYAGMFKPNDPAMVDGLEFVPAPTPKFGYNKGVPQVKLKQPKAPPAPFERIGEPVESEGSDRPRVDWESQDMADDGTADSVLQAYGRGHGNVYRAWVDPSLIPAPKGGGIVGGYPDMRGDYDWSELAGRGSPPPLKLRVGKNGKLVLMDGNHRLAWWREKGVSEVPAYIIDERPQAMDVPFSRNDGRGGVPIRDAEAVAAMIREANPTGPQIVVLEVSKAPDALLREIRKAGAANDVEGAYFNGTIYLFPQNVSDIDRLTFVGAHHEIRHAGLQALFGKRLDMMMLTISASNPGVLAAAKQKIANRHARSMSKATEEALADMPVEALVKLNGWDKIVAAVRTWLRDLAAKLRRNHAKLADMIEPETWTDKDVAALIQRAENISRGGKVPARSGATMFGRADNPTWYSALADQASKASMNAGPASAWQAMLKNWTTTGKVKADEVEWSGLGEWLDMQPGKVTKAQVGEFLAANVVQVTETVLGTQAPILDAVKEALSANDELGFDSTAQAMSMLRRDFNKSADADKVLDAYDFEAASDRLAVKRWLEANDLNEDKTTYDKYQLPGGTNYREVLLTLPGVRASLIAQRTAMEKRGSLLQGNPNYTEDRAAYDDLQKKIVATQDYKSNHWDQPNIVAHIRLNDRTDADGARVLFVEEIQSDWGQAGKKRGFAGGKATLPDGYIIELSQGVGPAFVVRSPDGKIVAGSVSDTKEQAAEVAADHATGRDTSQEHRPPAAPFVGKTDAWVALALKRVVKLAVDGGYDKVAFVTGQQSADRYDLSQQISQVGWWKTPSGEYGFIAEQDGNQVIKENDVSLDRIEEVFGKEIAQKISDGVGQSDWASNTYGPKVAGRLSRVDLKVGGKGMRAFYDKIVPSVAKDVLRKLGGGAMETVTIDRGAAFSPDVGEVRDQLDQPGFSITPAMRDKAAGGMPMFSRAPQTPSPGATWNTPGESKLDKVIYELQDKQVDLKRVTQGIKDSGVALNDRSDTYLREELYHGRVAARAQAFANKELAPLLVSMRAAGISLEALENYLHAQHANERNAEMRVRNRGGQNIDALSGMSDADAATIIAAAPPAMRALAQRVYDMIDATRDLMEVSGLEKPATMAAIRAKYLNYVPLYRDDLDPEGGRPAIGQGFSVKGSNLKRATGSNERVTNILAHVAMEREATITRSEKNLVAMGLYAMAVRNPAPDFWTADNAPKITRIDDRRQIMDMATGQLIANPDYNKVYRVVDPMYKTKENVVVVKVSGEDKVVVFNERNERAVRMAAALKNLDMEPMTLTLEIVAKGTRWLAAVNTQYNPVFSIVNAVRDVQSAALNLSTTPIAGEQAKVLGNAASALAGIWRAERDPAARGAWEDLWREYQLRGGQTGWRESFASPFDRTEALAKELAKGDRSVPSRAIHGLLDLLSDGNNAIENAVRLSAYKAARDKGLTMDRAASVGKNLTVNFNRKGATGQRLGALYAFFNASMQGTARMVEALRGPAGAKIVAGGVALGVLQALMLLGMDDDDRDSIPQFVLDRSFVIPLPEGKYIQIPMALGFNVLPNVGRHLAEMALAMKSGGRIEASKHLIEMAGAVAGAFNPFSGTGLLQSLTPTVADPIVDLATNQDFTGKAIYRERSEFDAAKPGKDLGRDSTSPAWKGAAYVINLLTGGDEFTRNTNLGAWASPQPEALRHIAETIGGGVWRETERIIEFAISAAKPGAEAEPGRLPFVSRFYGDTGTNQAPMNMFHKNMAALNKLERRIKGLAASEDQASDEKIDRLMASNPEAAMIATARATQRALTDLRNERRLMVIDDAAPDKLKAMDGEMAQLMREFNTQVREAIAGK